MVDVWVNTVTSFKKQLTDNWPPEMKAASDAFVDAQAQFARSAFRASMDFNAGLNKAMTDGTTALAKVAASKKQK